MGSRSAGRQLRLDAVHRAAAELFGSQGYEATTIRQIAERAGVSSGTVMNAGDKATLLLNVITAEIDDLMPRTTGFGGPPAEAVWLCFEPYFAFYNANPELSRPFAGLLMSSPDRDIEAMGRQAADFIALLAQQIRAAYPEVDDHSAAATAEALFAVYIFVLVQWASGKADLERAIAALRRQIDWQLSRFAVSA